MQAQSLSALKPVRAAAILTNSYVAGTALGIDDLNPSLNNQLLIYVDFTIGSLTDLLLKVEFSDDNTTFYQETFEAISGGVNTETLGERKIAATGKYRIALPVKDRFVKISAKGEGTVTSSSLKLDALVGVA